MWRVRRMSAAHALPVSMTASSGRMNVPRRREMRAQPCPVRTRAALWQRGLPDRSLKIPSVGCILPAQEVHTMRRFVLCAGAAVVLAGGQIAAQTPSRAAKASTIPRTADGKPDLRGIWSNATLTPFERPKESVGKEYFTQAEAAEFAKRVRAQSDRDRRGGTPQEEGG